MVNKENPLGGPIISLPEVPVNLGSVSLKTRTPSLNFRPAIYYVTLSKLIILSLNDIIYKMGATHLHIPYLRGKIM